MQYLLGNPMHHNITSIWLVVIGIFSGIALGGVFIIASLASSLIAI